MKRGLPMSPVAEDLLRLIEKRIKGQARRSGWEDGPLGEVSQPRARRERAS
jgi:hypothetical protein